MAVPSGSLQTKVVHLNSCIGFRIYRDRFIDLHIYREDTQVPWINNSTLQSYNTNTHINAYARTHAHTHTHTHTHKQTNKHTDNHTLYTPFIRSYRRTPV